MTADARSRIASGPSTRTGSRVRKMVATFRSCRTRAGPLVDKAHSQLPTWADIGAADREGQMAQMQHHQLPVDDLPESDAAAARQAEARNAELTKPAGALGRLEDLAIFLAGWQGRHPPRLERVRIAVFAGWHGIAARGVSAYPAEVTAQMVANFRAGGAAINQLAALAGAELAVVPVREGVPTADFTAGPAMSEEAFAEALEAGADQAAPGLDLLAVGEMGIANTTSAAAIAAALAREPASAWAGPGTGLDSEGVRRKAAVIEQALAHHRAALHDPVEVLRRLGGHEIAAMAAAILAARRQRTPVLLDGFTATAAAAVLHAIRARRRGPLPGRPPLRRARPPPPAGAARASSPCSTSACAWARPPVPPPRSRSSAPPSPATPAWPPSPAPGSASGTERPHPLWRRPAAALCCP